MSGSVKGAGDPEGKKLAKRKACAAEEACRLAECLAIQMRRVGVADDQVKQIARDLRKLTVEENEKAIGRVESRLVTRNTGHPLLEGRSVYYLFLDESGTAPIAADDLVFALGGVAMKEEDIDGYIQAADVVKKKFFGRTDVHFHEPDMRKHRNYFSLGGNVARQAEFDEAMQELVKKTPFVAFGVGIRKSKFKDEYVDTGCDPYLPTTVYELAIMLMMERYVDFLATNSERRIGRVQLESIGSRADAEHQAAYADLLLHGTQFVPESTFQSWVEAGCRFSPKKGTHPSELADLVARDMFEWTRGDGKVKPKYWDALVTKTYIRDDGYYGKCGFKVFPSTDMEDAIADHRKACGGL